jgi:hypothetical protein
VGLVAEKDRMVGAGKDLMIDRFTLVRKMN